MGGDLICELGLVLRENLITSGDMKVSVQKYIIGYCNGEALPCRPKTNHKAVMLCKDDRVGWFHLSNKEFQKIFNE